LENIFYSSDDLHYALKTGYIDITDQHSIEIICTEKISSEKYDSKSSFKINLNESEFATFIDGLLNAYYTDKK
jgi:hypothetical protein